MAIATINPATGQVLKTFEPLSDAQLEQKIQRAADAFLKHRKMSFADRAQRMAKAADILENDKEIFGRMMTTEMGKTFRSAQDEAVKCAWVCRYYAEHAEHFLADVANSRSRVMRLSAPAQRLLLGYSWPGNVRELKNAIERAGALAPGPSITAEDLSFLNEKSDNGQPLVPARFFEMSLPGAVEALERAMISHALALANNNRADAARRLGISRQTLYAKLAALGIE